MKRDDDALGMNCPISRRDFVHGVALAAGGAALPGWTGSAKAAVRAGEGASASTQAAFDPAGAGRDYPPERLGLRGSHPGSFEAAHVVRDRPTMDLSGAARTGETYDEAAGRSSPALSRASNCRA